jgi:hemolysin activation/secretion protein
MRPLPLLLNVLLATALYTGQAYAAEPDPAALHFDISSYNVEGSSLLTKEEIDSVVAPYIGKGKDFADVQRALEALEAAYVKRGYTAVQVMLPEQELEKGRVRFRVVESRFGQITLKGQKNFSEDNINNALPSLRTGNVPRSRQIARELKLANDNPARQMNVVLKAGKKEDQVDAEVQVDDQKPVSYGLSFDNTGTVETGQTRLGLSYRHANLFNADQVGSLQLQVSPQQMSRVRVFGGGYKIPLYNLGDSVEFFGGYSNVNSLVGGLTNFQGGGRLLSARYNHTLDRMGSFDPRLTAGFDWRDFKSIEQTKPTTGTVFNEIVVTPLSVAFAAQSRQERATTNFNIDLAVNVPMSSKGKKANFASYDPMDLNQPDSNFRIVHYDASHLQAITNDWQIRGALAGQWTSNTLVLGEQFRLGGMNGVRGFTEGSEAGDNGLRGSLEGYTPEMNYKAIKSRALAFFDAGKVHSGNGLKATINSIGFGLRSNWEQVSFRLDAGRIGKAGTDPLQKSGDWRLHAAVSASF